MDVEGDLEEEIVQIAAKLAFSNAVFVKQSYNTRASLVELFHILLNVQFFDSF